MTDIFAFDTSYLRLPDAFFARVSPTPVAAPKAIAVNVRLAEELGLDPAVLDSPEFLNIVSGNAPAAGSDPIATAYAGHQFGHFVPRLGDGRAILLGEIVTPRGRRFDVQLKGAGRTPFSRNGDGRAGLGPVLREYIVSEAMAALGVPTTRALAAVETGEIVWRERPLPGAVLTRVASSHIRIGTFQFFAARRDLDSLRLLADHVSARHYPAAQREASPYLALLEGVIERQARLVAAWLCVGFIHGVMNTDNVSIAGETIDFGPCAFLDAYDPAAVFSSIDANGRYAFQAQPNICMWNLTRLAECLLPLIDADEGRAMALARDELARFPDLYERAWFAGMARKLGFASESEADREFAPELLGLMAKDGVDFTLAFRALADAVRPDDQSFRSLFVDTPSVDAWLERWRSRLSQDARGEDAHREAMRAANPAFIPRNHRIEAVIAAAEGGDFSPFHTMNEILSAPYTDRPDADLWARPPADAERVLQTFCGT